MHKFSANRPFLKWVNLSMNFSLLCCCSPALLRLPFSRWWWPVESLSFCSLSIFFLLFVISCHPTKRHRLGGVTRGQSHRIGPSRILRPLLCCLPDVEQQEWNIRYNHTNNLQFLNWDLIKVYICLPIVGIGLVRNVQGQLKNTYSTVNEYSEWIHRSAYRVSTMVPRTSYFSYTPLLPSSPTPLRFFENISVHGIVVSGGGFLPLVEWCTPGTVLLRLATWLPLRWTRPLSTRPVFVKPPVRNNPSHNSCHTNR